MGKQSKTCQTAFLIANCCFCVRVAVSKPLSDRVAIVTGASSGIGAAIALALASAGARVAMAARREEKLRELEQRISDEGGVAISVKSDVLSRKEVGAIIPFLLVCREEEVFRVYIVQLSYKRINFATVMLVVSVVKNHKLETQHKVSCFHEVNTVRVRISSTRGTRPIKI